MRIYEMHDRIAVTSLWKDDGPYEKYGEDWRADRGRFGRVVRKARSRRFFNFANVQHGN
jgi:hypothetical protein